MALAEVRLAQGRDEEAERLAREALEIIERTDFVGVRNEMVGGVVDVLRRKGREDEAAALEERLAGRAACGFQPAPARSTVPIA